MEKDIKLKGGMLITARDIQLITGTTSENSAWREHRLVRDSLGKKTKRLSIKDYCDYWELDFEETIDFLQKNRL